MIRKEDFAKKFPITIKCCVVDGDCLETCCIDEGKPWDCSISRKKEYDNKEECPYWRDVFDRTLIEKTANFDNINAKLSDMKNEADKWEQEHWLKKELDKINIAIDAVRKINPIDSVVFPVEWYRETMITLETIKSDTCKRMGIEYDGNSVLRRDDGGIW